MFLFQQVEVLVEDGNNSVFITVPQDVLDVPLDFTQEFFRKGDSLQSILSRKNPYSDEDSSEHFDTLKDFLTDTVLSPVFNRIVRHRQETIDSWVERLEMDCLSDFLDYSDGVESLKDRVQELESECEWWKNRYQDQWEGYHDLLERVVMEIGKCLSHPSSRKSSLILRVFQESDSYTNHTEWYETSRQSIPSSVFETGMTIHDSKS